MFLPNNLVLTVPGQGVHGAIEILTGGRGDQVHEVIKRGRPAIALHAERTRFRTRLFLEFRTQVFIT